MGDGEFGREVTRKGINFGCVLASRVNRSGSPLRDEEKGGEREASLEKWQMEERRTALRLTPKP